MKLFFAKKSKIFERWGLRLQTPVPTAAGVFAPKPLASLAPRPPKQPPLPIFGYAPAPACGETLLGSMNRKIYTLLEQMMMMLN